MKTNRVPHQERRVLRILLQRIWWVYDSFNFIHSSVSAFVRQSIHPSLHFVCFPSFRSIVRSFIHSFCFIRLIGRSIIHSYSLIHWFIYSFIRSFLHSFIHSFIHLFIHSFVRSFVPSFLRSFVCSFIIYSSISKSDEDLPSIWTNSNMRWIQVMSVKLVCSVIARFLFISITKIHGRIRTLTHSHNRVANDQ